MITLRCAMFSHNVMLSFERFQTTTTLMRKFDNSCKSCAIAKLSNSQAAEVTGASFPGRNRRYTMSRSIQAP